MAMVRCVFFSITHNEHKAKRHPYFGALRCVLCTVLSFLFFNRIINQIHNKMEKILDLFLEKDGMRKWMRSPFTNAYKTVIFATDGSNRSC